MAKPIGRLAAVLLPFSECLLPAYQLCGPDFLGVQQRIPIRFVANVRRSHVIRSALA